MTRFSRIVIAVALTAISSPFSLSGLSAVELSGNVTLDEADGVTRGHLERVKVLIANRQWQETINTLRQLADAKGDRVVAAAPGYYVRIRDYCHRRLAALPPDALALYRDQVDAQARQWFDAATDADLLVQGGRLPNLWRLSGARLGVAGKRLLRLRCFS